MSDVERICQINHERALWKDEYVDTNVVDFPEEARRRDTAMGRYRTFRAGTMLAAGLAGVGITFLCLGVAIMSAGTIAMGAVMTLVFCPFGYWADMQAEKELDHVLFD